MPFSRWIPSSISVCSGENGRGSTLWLPLCCAHIYCNYIFLKFLLVALVLNHFFFMAIVEGKLREAGEVGVEQELGAGEVLHWEP